MEAHVIYKLLDEHGQEINKYEWCDHLVLMEGATLGAKMKFRLDGIPRDATVIDILGPIQVGPTMWHAIVTVQLD